jgi:pimeloyl-ACP methyl ester carboxylesterase
LLAQQKITTRALAKDRKMAKLDESFQAKSYAGYIKVDGHALYAEYDAPMPGCPTLVLLNGLSDSTSNWDRLIRCFKKPGYGILRFDFRGQGRSLLQELKEHESFDEAITVEEQSRHLELILDYFGITEPIHIIGMSYGGGIALYFASHFPGKVKKLVLVAPYLIRLDQALPLQRMWATQFELMKGLGIVPQAAFECAHRWYYQFLNHYMDHRFNRLIPEEAVRKASIQLTFGIMKFNAFPLLCELPDASVHLISGGRDTLVPRGLFSEMWSKLPERVKESWLYVEDGEHLLFEQYPEYLASWIERILAADPRLSQGQKFNGRGYSFEAKRWSPPFG